MFPDFSSRFPDFSLTVNFSRFASANVTVFWIRAWYITLFTAKAAREKEKQRKRQQQKNGKDGAAAVVSSSTSDQQDNENEDEEEEEDLAGDDGIITADEVPVIRLV